MAGRLINILANGFFLVMLAILVRKDLLLPYYADLPPSYRLMLRKVEKTETSRMSIHMLGQKIGISETIIEPLGNIGYRIANRTSVEGGFGSDESILEIQINSAAMVSSAYRLESFVVEVDLGFFEGKQKSKITGVVDGDTIVLTIESNGVERHERIAFDPDATMSSGFSSLLTMPDLEVGKEWNIRLINPLTMKVELASAIVEAREKIFWKGEEVDAFRVVVKHAGMRFNSWISLDGRVLKESGPFGLTLIREE